MQTHPFAAAPFLVLALAVAPAAAQSNFLTNGDAETGDLTGWTDVTGIGFDVTTVPVASGQFSFHPGFNGAPGPTTQELRQDVDITAFASSVLAGSLQASFSVAGYSSQQGTAFDPGNAVVEYRSATGAVLASYDTGTFMPFNAFHTFEDIRTVPLGTTTIRVRLIGNRLGGQSTDCYFDDVELGLYDWLATGPGCPGTNGTPELQVVSPPWLGETYAVDVTNLAGGFALIIHGLNPASVGLAPFGGGFGPSCVLLAAPDDVRFVPQAGGIGMFSLPLPLDPSLSGLALRVQALEFASPASAVSAGAATTLR